MTGTVPDAVAAACDSVDLIDLSPEALREPVGRLYPPGTAEQALAGYFRLRNLATPCAMAMRWVAEHGFDGPAAQLTGGLPGGEGGARQQRHRVPAVSCSRELPSMALEEDHGLCRAGRGVSEA